MIDLWRLYTWMHHPFRSTSDPAVAPRIGRRATGRDRAQDLAVIDDYRGWLLGVCERMDVPLPLDLDVLLLAIETYLGLVKDLVPDLEPPFQAGLRGENGKLLFNEPLDCTLEIVRRDWEGSQLYGACYRSRKKYVIALRLNAPRRLLIHSLGHEVGHVLRAHCDTGPQFYNYEAALPEDVEAEEIARAIEWLLETSHATVKANSRALRRRFWDIMGGGGQ